MTWTPADIPDQQGRTIVVTGAYGGLGTIVTRELAARGATVIMACRDHDRALAAAGRYSGSVVFEPLDLADLASIRRFAGRCPQFDVLINNAALMNVPFARTRDGFEMQFGVNHLGHFALTGLLLDRITDRVVSISSISHTWLRALHIDDLNYEHRRYSRSGAYAQSKLATLMCARELQHRLTESGSALRSYAVHPGISPTGLVARTGTPLDRIAEPAIRLVGQTREQAAHALLFAATAPDADPGTYWGPTRLFNTRGPVAAAPSSALSRDPALRRRLWEASERATGLRCPATPTTADEL